MWENLLSERFGSCVEKLQYVYDNIFVPKYHNLNEADEFELQVLRPIHDRKSVLSQAISRVHSDATSFAVLLEMANKSGVSHETLEKETKGIWETMQCTVGLDKVLFVCAELGLHEGLRKVLVGVKIDEHVYYYGECRCFDGDGCNIYRASVNAKDDNGLTALQISENNKHRKTEIMEILKLHEMTYRVTDRQLNPLPSSSIVDATIFRRINFDATRMWTMQPTHQALPSDDDPDGLD